MAARSTPILTHSTVAAAVQWHPCLMSLSLPALRVSPVLGSAAVGESCCKLRS
jgi:hypothetical protein